MVVDVGYGASQDGLFSSSYAQADVARIKWIIQEDLLLGRLTYERMKDSDGKGAGAADGRWRRGRRLQDPLALRHPARLQPGDGGRVATSSSKIRPTVPGMSASTCGSIGPKNLNVDSYDFDTLSLIGVYRRRAVRAALLLRQRPEPPRRAPFRPRGGYFDVTNKAFAVPQLVDLSHLGWGIDSFPACMLDTDFVGGTAPVGSCNPVEITLRQSFRRVVDQGLRAGRVGRLPVPSVRRLRARALRLRPQLRHERHQVAPHDLPLQHLGAQPLLRRSEGHDGRDPVLTPRPPRRAQIRTATSRTGTGPRTSARPSPGPRWPGMEGMAAVGPGSRCDTFKQRCTCRYQRREAVPQAWYVTHRTATPSISPPPSGQPTSGTSPCAAPSWPPQLRRVRPDHRGRAALRQAFPVYARPDGR